MKKLLSLIFVFLLFAPLGLRITGLDFSADEDKFGIKPPRFCRQAFLDNDYYQSFDQYFNDSFPLRGPMILLKNWIDYRVFRTTDSRDVHIGTDGWLYDVKSIIDYRKEAFNSRAYAEYLVLELHALEKIIQASGHRFFFFIAPNKSTIYPEFVGVVPKGNPCNRSLYDLFLENIARHPLNSFVRLDAPLTDEKNKGPLLYDKTSTRWNSRGAMVAAQSILKKVFDGHVQAASVPDLAPHQTTVSVDLTAKLMGRSVAVDDTYIGDFSPANPTGRLSTVAYGDSFMSSLIPYLNGMFKNLDMILTDHIPSKQHGEKLNSYDVILIETAESQMQTLHIDLNRIFSALEIRAPFMDTRRLDLTHVLPVSRISLETRKDGLAIKSLGSASIFKFISIPGSDLKTYRVLKLCIESPHPDVMTIESLTDPAHITQKPLKTGITELYLPMPLGDELSLRINPGNTVGVFILQSAEILNFPSDPDKISPKEEKPAMEVLDPENGQALSQNGSDMHKVIPNAGEAPIIVVTPRIATKNTAAEVMPRAVKASAEEKSRIAVTDYENGRIFQRNGNSRDMIVSGTYTGRPVAIEARVARHGDSEEIVPWSVVDACPKNGIFLGKLAGVPQGGWYNIQVRFSNNHEVFSMGSHKWGVGMLVGCIGQSNMKEWFYTGTNFNSHALLRKHTRQGWSELGMKGNAAITFGNRLVERLGIPVGLLDYSVNGSGLRKEADWGMGYWEDIRPGSIYNRFLSGVTAAGGILESVIWMQGEADAARGTVTEAEYKASLERFITTQVRTDMGNGSSRANLPFLIVMMVKRPGGKDGPNQAIRNAQKSVSGNMSDCYLAATTLDLENHGRQHLAPDAYTTLGLRVAQTVLYILGKEKYYRGPRVTAVNRVDGSTWDVTIQHSGGTDFAPISRISGWEVLAGGTHLPVSEVFRRDAETIRIVLKNTGANDIKIRYLYGAMPDTSRPVLDNSEMSLPLEEYH